MRAVPQLSLTRVTGPRDRVEALSRATRNQREIWYMKSGPSRVNAPLEGLRFQDPEGTFTASEIGTIQAPRQTGLADTEGLAALNELECLLKLEVVRSRTSCGSA